MIAYQPYYAPFGKNNFLTHFKETEQHGFQNILQASNKPVDDSLADAKLKRKANWAKWLGIGSLAGLLIPFINLLSLPAAIAAVVVSHQIPKESEYNKDAATGRRTG